MNRPPPPNPSGRRDWKLLVLLHACFLGCSGVASPVVGLMALGMAFAWFGAATSAGAHYTGGSYAILLFVVFALTPVFSVLHGVGVVAALRRRSTGKIWVLSLAYLVLVWLGLLLRPNKPHFGELVSSSGSMLPPMLLIGIPTLATFAALVLHAKASWRKTGQT